MGRRYKKIIIRWKKQPGTAVPGMGWKQNGRAKHRNTLILLPKKNQRLHTQTDVHAMGLNRKVGDGTDDDDDALGSVGDGLGADFRGAGQEPPTPGRGSPPPERWGPGVQKNRGRFFSEPRGAGGSPPPGGGGSPVLKRSLTG